LMAGSPSVLNLFQLRGLLGGAAAEFEQEDAAAIAVRADPALIGSSPVDPAPVGSPLVDPAPVGSSAPGSRPVGTATALHLELQAPPPSVARSLRLGAGRPAMIITIRFDDVASGRPVALTIAVLRPEMFRLVLQTPFRSAAADDAANLPGSWTHSVEGWEP
jgi:hypothetical protein